MKRTKFQGNLPGVLSPRLELENRFSCRVMASTVSLSYFGKKRSLSGVKSHEVKGKRTIADQDHGVEIAEVHPEELQIALSASSSRQAAIPV